MHCMARFLLGVASAIESIRTGSIPVALSRRGPYFSPVQSWQAQVKPGGGIGCPAVRLSGWKQTWPGRIGAGVMQGRWKVA